MRYRIHTAVNRQFFLACIILSPLLLLLLVLARTPKNIVTDRLLFWGAGWNDRRSRYAGSELGFVVEKAGSVSVEFVRNSKADQGIEMIIDGKSIRSTEIKDSIFTVSIDPKKRHLVTIRHVCTYLYDPCDVFIKQIVLERSAMLHPYTQIKPILSILGDSISTMYGSSNYTRILADATGHQLHNASIMGSSVSRIPNVDSALMRYETDLKDIQSNRIIIFLGTNDVKNNIPLDLFEKNYSDMITNIRNWQDSTHIFLVGILPRKDVPSNEIDRYNPIIKRIADTHNAQYVDTSDWITHEDLADDIHPSVQGQKKISEEFEIFLEKYAMSQNF